MENITAQPVDSARLREFDRILERYRSGKARTEQRIQDSERWWKLRNGGPAARSGEDFRSVSGWLHNVIVQKHADAMDAYPEPRILPREREDRAEAAVLTAILPCILEQNHFERVYSDLLWQKLKTGTGVYRVAWDSRKLHGLGDIDIRRVNLLNLYWEPGVENIQASRYLFHTELWDKEALLEQYPELEGKLKGGGFRPAAFPGDEREEREQKLCVIQVYYKRKGLLHYCKYVGDQLLFASENEPQMAARGLYDHGQYPFVFDPLFPIEQSPCGYGFVDICRNPQTEIDLLKTAFVRNAAVGAAPRYFSRGDGAVNEEEFLDLSKPIVHVSGNLGADSLRPIDYKALDGTYVSLLDRSIQELRETSGNTETSTGNISRGITAASAIAALQEASSKGSRDCQTGSYRAFGELMELCIELIRQFYDSPRQFRILGPGGGEDFLSYQNRRLRPQSQGALCGLELGMRLPVFDVKISAQKRSAYTRMSRNELALQLYGQGFFRPENAGPALQCLEMMDFEGKGELMERLRREAGLQEKLRQYMQLSLALTRRARPELAAALEQDYRRSFGAAAPAAALPHLSREDPAREAEALREEAAGP